MLEAGFVPLFFLAEVYAAIGACVTLIALDPCVRGLRRRLAEGRREAEPAALTGARSLRGECMSSELAKRGVVAVLAGAIWPVSLAVAAGLAVSSMLTEEGSATAGGEASRPAVPAPGRPGGQSGLSERARNADGRPISNDSARIWWKRPTNKVG